MKERRKNGGEREVAREKEERMGERGEERETGEKREVIEIEKERERGASFLSFFI